MQDLEEWVFTGVGERKTGQPQCSFPGSWLPQALAPIPGMWDVGGAALSLGQLPVCKATEEGTQSPLSWKRFRGQGGGFGN